MKFQITIRTAGGLEGTMTKLAVFVAEAPNWEVAATRAVALGMALGLEYGQYESEIIYASKEDNMIRSGSLHRVENAFTPDRKVENVLPPLDRCVEMLLTQERNVITDEENPAHFIQTPLDLEQRSAVKETAKYLRRINAEATGVHCLTTREQEVSLFFSAMFAMPIYLFRDGNWICESVDHTKKCGIGTLPVDALTDFMKSNSIEMKNPNIVG